MISFDFDRDCCACTACVNICAHSAINMILNEDGFLMPVVDMHKCTDCGLCEKVCPHLNTTMDIESFSMDSFSGKKSYLYFSKNGNREKSASGGFVHDSYRKCLSDNGMIAGCVWNKEMEAIHIVTNKDENLAALQSSKYVQSNLQDTYKQIRIFLREGKSVVFCGTPCQTAGLHHFLGKADTSNLLSIALICHGVASPGVWKRWVRIMEMKYHGKLVDVNMRDKSYKGYTTSYSKYTFVDDCERTDTKQARTRIVGMPTFLADPYLFLFTDDLYIRRSCNHCQFKATQSLADIIVGDYYASIPEAGNLGCSSLIALTDKGDRFVHSLDGVLYEIEIAKIAQSMLYKSVKENPRRKEFFDLYRKTTDTQETMFTSFLPLRFKVKKTLNQMGVFNYWLMLKRKIKK